MELQPFVEQLYENESHTSALTDDGARVLLEWGERQLNIAATRNPSQSQLEQTTRQLSRVLRAINRLIDLKAELTDEQLVARLLTLTEQAMALQSLSESGDSQT